MTEFLTTGPATSRIQILLAHGAGAPMTSPFMASMAELLAASGHCVSRFEFDYMAKRRVTGKRTPPPKAERLVDEYVAAVAQAHGAMRAGQSLIIGGKSMGGRVASLAAQSLHDSGLIIGLVCLGYPFHPTGRPDELRTAHLAALTAPALIVQGERDPFGSRPEVEAMRAKKRLSPAIEICWTADGDHDFGPRGNSGHTRKGNMAAAVKAVSDFCERLGPHPTG